MYIQKKKKKLLSAEYPKKRSTALTCAQVVVVIMMLKLKLSDTNVGYLHICRKIPTIREYSNTYMTKITFITITPFSTFFKNCISHYLYRNFYLNCQQKHFSKHNYLQTILFISLTINIVQRNLVLQQTLVDEFLVQRSTQSSRWFFNHNTSAL